MVEWGVSPVSFSYEVESVQPGTRGRSVAMASNSPVGWPEIPPSLPLPPPTQPRGGARTSRALSRSIKPGALRHPSRSS